MSPFLVQHVVYPLYERLAGRRVLGRWREFERNQWLSRSDIKGLQAKRLCDLLRHAYSSVPFYRSSMRAAGIGPSDLADSDVVNVLPLLTKADILDHRDELVADDYPRSQLRPNATGGSTGHMLSFYNDRASLDVRSAVTLRGDRWAGLDIGTPHARLWGAPLDIRAQERFSNRVANRLLNRLWLDCFRLSEEILADYVRRLRRFRPRVLLGYASALATLARYVKANDIHDIGLTSVISSAETLFDGQRQEIEEAFGCKVYDRYGCREAGPLVSECPEGRMHVSADYVYFELISTGRAAQPGEVGEIVITPLFGYGMPLIRYCIGDLAVAAEQKPCPCGRGLPLIERVIGRTSDMLVNATGDLFHGEYFTHLFYGCPGVRQFQVIQQSTRDLLFRMVVDQDFDRSVLIEIENKIRGFAGPMAMRWEFVDEIPPLPSGKRSFTVSEVPAQSVGGGGLRPRDEG